MTVKIGQLGYLHSSAAGKSILSFSDEKTRSDLVRQIELIKFNDNTITEKKGLLDEINKIREIGTSIDEEEEQIGAKCVGGPIMNNDKKLVGAISISAPSKRFDKNFQMLQSELKKVLELASKEVIKRILF